MTQAPQSISFAAMGRRQQAVAQVVLKDPAVESLSSFIGVDGTNATLTVPHADYLKPKSARNADATGVIRRLQDSLTQVHGIEMYMQPVQDLTIRRG